MLLIAASPPSLVGGTTKQNDCASIVVLWLPLLPSIVVSRFDVLPSKRLTAMTGLVSKVIARRVRVKSAGTSEVRRSNLLEEGKFSSKHCGKGTGLLRQSRYKPVLPMLLIAASPRNDCASIVVLWLPLLPSKRLVSTTYRVCKSLRGGYGLSQLVQARFAEAICWRNGILLRSIVPVNSILPTSPSIPDLTHLSDQFFFDGNRL